jgi:hypothetical protein
MEGELALGRAAYASKDYAEAIEHFTEVLEDVDCPQDQSAAASYGFRTP